MKGYPKMKRNEVCGTCIFFNRESIQDKTGQCRRNPPLVFFAGYDPATFFPEVRIGEWCGEYKPNEEVLEALKRVREKHN